MKKILNLLSFLLFLASSLTAQQNNNTTPTGDGNGTSNKPQSLSVSNAIQKFKTSEFMVRFNDFKTQMETDVRDFIGRQNSYSVKDVRRVQISYDKTAAQFNKIMLEIKQDFMDKEKVKMINKFPDMYTNGLKGKIDGLEDFYRANFNQTLESVTESGGSALLLATLLELIKAAGDLSQHFKTLKFEKEYMNDQYIQQNLVEPNKLPTWAQILANTPIKTDVKIHPSRQTTTSDNGNNGGNNNGGNDNGGNNNGGNNNGGNNNGGNDNGGNNNGGNDNGGNNNGGNDNTNGGNGKNFNDGTIEQKTAPQFGVEGASTLETPQKVAPNSPGGNLKKKTVKPNTPN